MKEIDKLVTGIVAVGLVTAFALHASGLAGLVGQVGRTGSQLEGTAIKG